LIPYNVVIITGGQGVLSKASLIPDEVVEVSGGVVVAGLIPDEGIAVPRGI